jgi:serine/threonine-protein kinase
VVFLTPEQADAYAAWCAARDGLQWRLPHDLEREKAARGVDGRLYPWGSRFEPTWTRMQGSLEGIPCRADVGEMVHDVGPYGMRGGAGNVRDVCHNGYRRGGVPDGVSVVTPDPVGPDEPLRMLRGGSWTAGERQCRLATRVVTRVGVGLSVTGVRLVRGVSGPGC